MLIINGFVKKSSRQRNLSTQSNSDPELGLQVTRSSSKSLREIIGESSSIGTMNEDAIAIIKDMLKESLEEVNKTLEDIRQSNET